VYSSCPCIEGLSRIAASRGGEDDRGPAETQREARGISRMISLL
jgi:hypothetical protein